MIHLFLEAIGVLAISAVTYSFAKPALQGLRMSISFHATAYKGLRKSGRTVKWRQFPLSLLMHAWELAGCGKHRTVSIRGSGYYWSSEGARETWDDRIRTTDHGGGDG